MQNESVNVLWLDAAHSVSMHELVEHSGLSEGEVRALVEGGALKPNDPDARAWTFGAECVLTVRKAARLRDELELDPHALAVALRLLEQIDELERQLSQLRAQHRALLQD
jgi:chaperone modulatory protein CbpM